MNVGAQELRLGSVRHLGVKRHRGRNAVAGCRDIANPNINVRPGAPTLGPDMSRVIGKIPFGTRVEIDGVVGGPAETGLLARRRSGTVSLATKGTTRPLGSATR